METKQKKNQNYDAWLNWPIPGKCNLFCEYCFNHPAEEKKLNTLESIRYFLSRLKRKRISLVWIFGALKTRGFGKKIYTINIPALTRTLDKTNKIFRINFTGGGEPFLISNIIEVCIEITKKHYISFNTNLISKRIEEFCEKIDPQKVVLIHASLHIKELEKLNLLDTFVRNFLLCKERDFNIIAVEIAYPKLLDEVDKYKEFFRKNGIEFIFSRFQGIYHGKEYPTAYTEQELETFGIKNAPNSKLSFQGEICNAGYNAGVVLKSGDVMLCSDVAERLGHIYKSIKFKDHLIKCPVAYCGCPLHICDPYLYERALKESKVPTPKQGDLIK